MGILTSACATQIHSDYPQYLAKNPTNVPHSEVAKKTSYFLDEATENHSIEIRSFMAGAANTWAVQFGKVLDATMNSDGIKQSFGSVSKTSSTKIMDGLFLKFSLQNYQFDDFTAKVALKVSAQSDGQNVLSKVYEADGASQGGKMFWGGAFAMKNAVQQSTKVAVDRFFTKLIADLKVSKPKLAYTGDLWPKEDNQPSSHNKSQPSTASVPPKKFCPASSKIIFPHDKKEIEDTLADYIETAHTTNSHFHSFISMKDKVLDCGKLELFAVYNIETVGWGFGTRKRRRNFILEKKEKIFSVISMRKINQK
jgi:hypothetical protein